MLTDRELLEKAAKAAGMHLTENGVRDLGDWEYLYAGDYKWGLFANNANGTQRMWNPLLDDGDALRLAVKVLNWPHGGRAFDNAVAAMFAVGKLPSDPYAATRRAIVRAAAAIGEHHGS